MKAVLFPSANEVKVGQLSDPEVAPGDVLIRIKASGICHTDIEVMRGNYGTSKYPLVPGHEFSGEIAGVGSEVVELAVGDHTLFGVVFVTHLARRLRFPFDQVISCHLAKSNLSLLLCSIYSRASAGAKRRIGPVEP